MTTPAPPQEKPRAATLLPHPLPPSQVKQYLAELTEDPWTPEQPTPMLWGGPGCAKSSITAQLAGERSWGFIDIRLTQVQVIDILGLPYIDRLMNGDGRTTEAITRFAPAETPMLSPHARLLPGPAG